MAYDDNNYFSIANSQNVPTGTFGGTQTNNPFSVGTSAGMNNTPVNNPISIGNSPNLINRGVNKFGMGIMPTLDPGFSAGLQDFSPETSGQNFNNYRHSWDGLMNFFKTGSMEGFNQGSNNMPQRPPMRQQNEPPIRTNLDFMAPPQRQGSQDNSLLQMMMQNYMQNKTMLGIG